MSGACQAVWLKGILNHLGLEDGECTSIMCENTSTIKLSRNPVFHGRSRHIRVHFLKELINEGSIELLYCGTGEHIADIMTKPLKKKAFVKLRSMMGMCEFNEIS